MMAFDVERAQAHIVELCEAHDIVIGSSTRGRATRGQDGHAIAIPPVRGQVTYFLALHEIGHLIGPGRSGHRLEKEANAWAYALDVALWKPTPATRRAIQRRLWSYLSWAFERQHRKHPPQFPDAKHIFWKLVREKRSEWVDE